VNARICRVRPALLGLALLLVPGSLTGQAQNDAADTARLVEVLRLSEGSSVADIGAGLGDLTVRMARHVGPNGTVYSTDINPERLQDIRAAATKAGMENVRIVEGGSTRTNLPGECCDAAFMRHVYHHIGDPPAMNASIRQSLKAGGRVAIVDFQPRGGQTGPPGRRDQGLLHGVTPDVIIEELQAAGFVEVQQLPWSSPGYFLVVGKRQD